MMFHWKIHRTYGRNSDVLALIPSERNVTDLWNILAIQVRNHHSLSGDVHSSFFP